MSYNRINYYKFAAYVMQVYSQVKEYDIPDTYIVRHVFPKHHIYISYRKWMKLKAEMTGEKEASPQQPSLFD